MSDDETPDNVVQLPRIGSPPPPPVPLPPDLDGTGPAPDDGGGPVRISSFDAPPVPVAPQSTGTVPAALRADGLDPPPPAPDAGPPHTGTLTLAAVLAIALAAFEGLQSWIKESGPRRLEAAKHQREMELLAAKAGADADRLGAQADAQRARSQRVPSSHEYGRGALGRGTGSPGRSGAGTGPGGPRRNGTGHNTGHRSGGTGTGSASGRGPGSQRPGSGAGGGAGRGPGSPRGTGGGSGGSPGRGTKGGGQHRPPGHRGPGGFGGGTRGPGGRGGGTPPGAGGTRNGPHSTPKSGPRPGNGTGTGSGSGSGGRRSPRQVISDVLHGRRRDQSRNGSRRTDAQAGARPASTQARIADAVQRQARRAQPTRWEALGSRIRDRWKRRWEADTAAGANRPDWTPPQGGGRRDTAGGHDRVTLGRAVADAFWDRWEKRREHWKASGGPRRPSPPRKPKKPQSATAGTSPGPAGPGPASGTSPGGASEAGAWAGPRSSPFDAYGSDEPEVTITSVVQDGPARSNAKRWEPEEIAPARPALPRQGPPALPRAPQRPAGSRPGTTRRKEPIAMPPAPRSASNPGAVAPVSASVPAPGGMSAQHATELRLDTALKVLEALTTSGMETHDDCAQLARLARRLLGEIEAMAHDLARNHNVTGSKTMKAIAALLEEVGDLVVQTERMARDCLAAGELAEAEEAAMARDHRPMQTAYLDAGVTAPSARIHNEN